MIISTSNFTTVQAADYLQQLCAHFVRRVPISQNDRNAQITLPIGRCDLTASDTAIKAEVHASANHIDRMEAVIGGWIERFAFRENANLEWHRATSKNGE